MDLALLLISISNGRKGFNIYIYIYIFNTTLLDCQSICFIIYLLINLIILNKGE